MSKLLQAVFCRAGAFGIALAVVASFPACAVDIVVTQYNSDPGGAPFAIALERGFFKQSGSSVTGVISGEGGGSSVRAVIASDLGFGEVSASSAIAAIIQGQDIKIVALGTPRFASNLVITMATSPLKSIADAKGKKFAISNPKSVSELISSVVAEQAGLKKGDFQLVALGNNNGIMTGLESGAVDLAVTTNEMYWSRGGGRKYRILLRGADMLPMASAVEIATSSLINKHPRELRAALAARQLGVRFIYYHTQNAAKLLAKLYAPLPEDTTNKILRELIAAHFWSEGKIDMDSFRNLIKGMRAVGMLDSDIDLNKIIDARFLPDDQKK